MRANNPGGDGVEEKSPQEPSENGWLYWIWLLLAAIAYFGLLFNLNQLESSDLFIAHLVDVMALSYSNLLAYPFLFFTYWFSREKRNRLEKEMSQLAWWAFWLTPFAVVAFQLALRILERLW
jgi:hypothetical protein